jgi:hypothetical protein
MERQFLVDRHWLAERFKQRLRTPLAASPGRQRAPVRHLGVDWWRRLGRGGASTFWASAARDILNVWVPSISWELFPY